MATQQLLKCFGQLNSAPGAGTRRLRIQINQEVNIAGFRIELGTRRRAKQLQMRHAILLAQCGNMGQLTG